MLNDTLLQFDLNNRHKKLLHAVFCFCFVSVVKMELKVGMTHIDRHHLPTESLMGALKHFLTFFILIWNLRASVRIATVEISKT